MIHTDSLQYFCPHMRLHTHTYRIGCILHINKLVVILSFFLLISILENNTYITLEINYFIKYISTTKQLVKM